MQALEEIRKKQAEITLQFRPISAMYNLLEDRFPDIIEKEEADSKSTLEKDWEILVANAEVKRNDMQGEQAAFKRDLIGGIEHLVVDVKEFRVKFDTEGPAVDGIEPREALNRLRMFADEYSVRKRKFDSYFAGENLFGLPHTDYPELVKTE